VEGKKEREEKKSMATADQGAEPIDVFSPPGSPRSARHNGSAPARKREPPKIIGGARFEAPRRGANRSASKVNLIMWTRQINQALRGTGTEVTHTTFEGSDGDVRFFVDSKEPEKEPAIHAALHRVMPRSVSIKSSQAVLGTPSVLRNVVSVLITVQHQENCDWWDQWMRLLPLRSWMSKFPRLFCDFFCVAAVNSTCIPRPLSFFSLR